MAVNSKNSSDLVARLRTTLGKMEVALGAIAEAIVWTDGKGQVQWSNVTFDQLVKLDRFSILGANLIEILPLSQEGEKISTENHPVSHALFHHSNGTQNYEFWGCDEWVRLEVSWNCVHINDPEVSAVLAIRDISAQYQAQQQLRKYQERLEELVEERTAKLVAANRKLKKMQMQLIQTEKMSGLGQLVAGIAHEINNPVNFIHGNLSYVNHYVQDLIQLVHLYQEKVSKVPQSVQKYQETIELDYLIQDLPKVLTSMKVGTERIREIVLSLRKFSRIDEAEVKSVDLHEGIESTLMILQHSLQGNFHQSEIQVIKNYGPLPLVECYAGQLNQVFMHILGNAIAALKSCSKFSSHGSQEFPTIEIQTEVLDSNFVVVQIKDNGPGMAEAIQTRIFDPFFTTKPVGQGTGLGLSISYQIIVEKHGGKLTFTSNPGEGTTFRIELPTKCRK